jgi:hypothetical protein
MLGRAPVTDEQDAEAAARVHAQSIVEGDMGTMVRGMTPDGLASAMALGNTTWNPLSYEIKLSAVQGDDFVFHITYDTKTGPLALSERFRQIDGEWKVVDVQPAG